jgi:hypothetical protein
MVTTQIHGQRLLPGWVLAKEIMQHVDVTRREKLTV